MPRNPNKIDYSGGFPQGFEVFASIQDPRNGGNTRHHFGEILFSLACVIMVHGKARDKLNAVLASLGQTSRAWELKESFRRFWSYRSPTWAAAYLKAWTSRAMRSRIEPMKKVARMLRKHEDLLLNYFRAKRQYTNAMVEVMNGVRVHGFTFHLAWLLGFYGLGHWKGQ